MSETGSYSSHDTSYGASNVYGQAEPTTGGWLNSQSYQVFYLALLCASYVVNR